MITERAVTTDQVGATGTAPLRPPAFAPTALARVAAAALAVVLIAGIAGGILHTGLFFLPALVVLVIGGRSLLREQP